ncbi:MAG: hypothetical protein LQ340_004993 [Diploschistes diacapsis]|nr:MAG: hypothetical protein LQ340_004993 [Diploschistes diacapsis]
MSKIAKTIARQQQKIAEGQFYEAHQQLRVVSARHTKAQNWNDAIEVLYNGGLSLLKAGQGGSGGDLSLLLVDTMVKGEVVVTPESKGKIFTLLRAFPPDEPTKKKFISEATAWTAKFGEYENGDPELHHVAGTLYAEDCEPYDAERHLALGTKDSPESLIRLEYEWYKQDESHTAALYAARAVFPYLLTRNLRSANKAFIIFTSRLSANNQSLSAQEVSSSKSDIRVYPSLPLLNFLSLLLLAATKGSADLFRSLTKHYATHIKEVGIWDDALAQIGEMYFNIKIPRQGNPLFDMMGSMLFGGGGGGKAKKTPKRVDAPSEPPAAELD